MSIENVICTAKIFSYLELNVKNEEMILYFGEFNSIYLPS